MDFMMDTCAMCAKVLIVRNSPFINVYEYQEGARGSQRERMVHMIINRKINDNPRHTRKFTQSKHNMIVIKKLWIVTKWRRGKPDMNCCMAQYITRRMKLPAHK